LRAQAVAVIRDGARHRRRPGESKHDADGVTPHATNKRATHSDDEAPWSASSRNTSCTDGRPLGFPTSGYPAPQGPYYTGVGYSNVGPVAREIVEKHLELCLFAGINTKAFNAEVAKGQWEFRSSQGLQKSCRRNVDGSLPVASG